MKRYIKDYLVLLLFAGIVIALDQWTKYLIRSNLAVGEIWVPWDWLAPYARLVHWYNTGVAFGMFQGKGFIFGIFAIIVAIAIIIYYPQVPSKDWILRIAMCLQLAGAMGNLVDRLTVGHVTDFISIGTFPVFNIADSSITVGTAVMLLGLWIQERNSRSKTDILDQEIDQPDQMNSEAPN